MRFRHVFLIIIVSGLALNSSCTEESKAATVLRSYSCDDKNDVLTSEGVEVDQELHQEGRACFRIKAAENRVIQLYETGDIDAEDTTIIYEASLKTQNLEGKAYLEMWCVFNEKGEFFSRGLDQILSGSADWTRVATPFFLKTDENPDNIRLNLVIEGKGTAWIDDIKLLKQNK